MSMINWHQDLFRDLTHICEISLLDREERTATDLQRYTRSLAEWRSIAHYPNLVSNLYLARTNAAGSELLRYNAVNGHFQSEAWTARFLVLKQELARARGTGPADVGTVPDHDHRPISRLPIANAFYPVRLQGWQFEPNIPALMYRLQDQGDHLSPAKWIVVELNQDVLRNNVFPDLARRHFQGTDGLDFQVAVVGGSPSHVIYSSDANFGQQPIPDADGVLNIFGRPEAGTPESSVRVFQKPPTSTGLSNVLDIPWFPVFSAQPPEQDWQLLVRHRRGGPLGPFVVEMRNRNLAVSFVVIVLLVASLGTLLITTRRAQSLARLQMDFVTTVSHELRTPLTAISAAADNIARGVVDGKQHMIQYGSLIQNQTRRLSSLVEQVLLFTAMRQGRQWYALRAVDVQEIVSTSLTATSSLPQFSQFTFETDVEANLPRVMCDPALLSQCIQNLISNALKYSDTGKWVGISATLNQATNEVEISVMDRGIGIAPDDLPHIFEPFYRSQSVVLAQVRGTGIGLAVGKNIAEVFHGRLTVKSSLGKGSTFTLHIPCAVSEQNHADGAVR
jgi:signal transduction histidine kinase